MPKDNVHEGHRQRMKNRFLEDGLDSFQPHEILELLLYYARPRIDTNEIAHSLINQFGSLSAVLDAPFEDIAKVKGVGDNAATLLKMIPQMCKVYSVDTVSNEVLDTSKKVCSYFRNMFIGEKHEQLVVACLDDRLRVVAYSVVIEGTVSSLPVNIRKIVEFIFKTKCDYVILAHNHPKGTEMASKEDVSCTRQIQSVLKSVGVKLLDHVIVGNRGRLQCVMQDILLHLTRRFIMGNFQLVSNYTPAGDQPKAIKQH